MSLLNDIYHYFNFTSCITLTQKILIEYMKPLHQRPFRHTPNNRAWLQTTTTHANIRQPSGKLWEQSRG